MAVKIIKSGSGLIFDTSELEGSGEMFSKRVYFPITSIAQISLYNNRVIGYNVTGENWDMTIKGENASYPISEVGGVKVTNVEEIYASLIALI